MIVKDDTPPLINQSHLVKTGLLKCVFQCVTAFGKNTSNSPATNEQNHNMSGNVKRWVQELDGVERCGYEVRLSDKNENSDSVMFDLRDMSGVELSENTSHMFTLRVSCSGGVHDFFFTDKDEAEMWLFGLSYLSDVSVMGMREWEQNMYEQPHVGQSCSF